MPITLTLEMRYADLEISNLWDWRQFIDQLEEIVGRDNGGTGYAFHTDARDIVWAFEDDELNEARRAAQRLLRRLPPGNAVVTVDLWVEDEGDPTRIFQGGSYRSELTAKEQRQATQRSERLKAFMQKTPDIEVELETDDDEHARWNS